MSYRYIYFLAQFFIHVQQKNSKKFKGPKSRKLTLPTGNLFVDFTPSKEPAVAK